MYKPTNVGGYREKEAWGISFWAFFRST